MSNSVRENSSSPTSSSVGHPHRWFILVVVLMAEVMDLLDGTIVNIAAPAIQGDLGASSTALQWIVGGYPLAIAVGLITGGRLGDLHGRKRMFLLGCAGFTFASLLCAVAPSTGTLIAARLLQGALGAAMLPQGFGLMRDVFPPEEIGKAFGLFGPVIGSAAVFGPIIGGGLVDLDLLGTGWRLVFLVNLPVGLTATYLGWRLLPDVRDGHAQRLDLLGTAIITAGSLLVVYPLIQGRELDWPAWTFASVAAGIALFVVFGLQQRARDRAGHDPLVTPSVFAQRGFSAGLAVAAVFFAGMIGSLLALTLYLQIGEGFSAIHAGLTLIPSSVGLVVGAGLSGGFLGPRFGRIVLQAGAVVALGGWLLVILALHGDSTLSAGQLVPGLLVQGLGIGLIVAPMFDIILAAVTDPETGSASGVLNAAQQLAGAVGVAVLGTIFFTAAEAGDFATALSHTLWVTVGMLAAVLLLSPLLPRFARPPAAEVRAAPAA
ncbi:MAG: major facilitator superfamily 1 [Solirubrobacterales bacterium]|nr:major facilitator superfamily 1 [Solirubrobacterales bacterium]